MFFEKNFKGGECNFRLYFLFFRQSWSQIMAKSCIYNDSLATTQCAFEFVIR